MKNRFPNLPQQANDIASKLTEIGDKAEEQLARLEKIRVQNFEERLIANMIEAGAFSHYGKQTPQDNV